MAENGREWRSGSRGGWFGASQPRERRRCGRGEAARREGRFGTPAPRSTCSSCLSPPRSAFGLWVARSGRAGRCRPPLGFGKPRAGRGSRGGWVIAVSLHHGVEHEVDGLYAVVVSLRPWGGAGAKPPPPSNGGMGAGCRALGGCGVRRHGALSLPPQTLRRRRVSSRLPPLRRPRRHSLRVPPSSAPCS